MRYIITVFKKFTISLLLLKFYSEAIVSTVKTGQLKENYVNEFCFNYLKSLILKHKTKHIIVPSVHFKHFIIFVMPTS